MAVIPHGVRPAVVNPWVVHLLYTVGFMNIYASFGINCGKPRLILMDRCGTDGCGHSVHRWYTVYFRTFWSFLAKPSVKPSYSSWTCTELSELTG